MKQMSDFIFIIPKTPSQYMTRLRMALFRCMVSSLKQQTYQNWQALIIGEESCVDSRIRFVHSSAVTKVEKLEAAWELVLREECHPSYVIRLDDDDIIASGALSRASKLVFDCYGDRAHTFFDIETGYVYQKKRPWLPNTVIHSFKHANCSLPRHGKPLIMSDHSADWKDYYKDKKMVYTSSRQPLYMRVLTPTSVSVVGKGGDRTSDFDLDRHRSYVSSCGRRCWRRPQELRSSIIQLRRAWTKRLDLQM